MYKITEASLQQETSLGPISSAAKISCGDVTASRRYLVAPGWLDDSGPVVAAWNKETGSVSTLRPDRPTCPYRSFRKTAITGQSGHKILGLLDRLRLHCWDGQTGRCVFTVDLSNTMVRDNLDQAWLAVSQHFILTVHQDLNSVTVLSAQGGLLANIVPVLSAQHQHPDWRVTEVALHHTTTMVFIRLQRDISTGTTGTSSLILKADLTKLLTRPGEGSSTVAATVVGEAEGEAGSGSRLFAEETKLLSVNTQPLQLQVFNYFDQ